MVRPLKADRESVALTHVRISTKTKTLLDRVKIEGGYKTHDEALLNLLQQPQPTKQPLTITRDMLRRQDINKLISGTSSEIYRKYVAPSKSKQPDKGKSTKASARSRSSFKSNYKF